MAGPFKLGCELAHCTCHFTAYIYRSPVISRYYNLHNMDLYQTASKALLASKQACYKQGGGGPDAASVMSREVFIEEAWSQNPR